MPAESIMYLSRIACRSCGHPRWDDGTRCPNSMSSVTTLACGSYENPNIQPDSRLGIFNDTRYRHHYDSEQVTGHGPLVNHVVNRPEKGIPRV